MKYRFNCAHCGYRQPVGPFGDKNGEWPPGVEVTVGCAKCERKSTFRTPGEPTPPSKPGIFRRVLAAFFP